MLRRRISFAGSLSEAGKAYRSRPADPDELWLDRTQLFLGTLRESCYRIVGSAAQQGVLYEISPLLYGRPRHSSRHHPSRVDPRYAAAHVRAIRPVARPVPACWWRCCAVLCMHG